MTFKRTKWKHNQKNEGSIPPGVNIIYRHAGGASARGLPGMLEWRNTSKDAEEHVELLPKV